MEKTANEITSPSSKREAFDDWKDKKSGKLDKKKALNALFETGQNPIFQDIEKFWKKNRKSDSDLISYEEFEELYNDLGNPRKTLREALLHFDTNRNGKIDREELKGILKAAGELQTNNKETEDSYVDLILSFGDRNKDHELDIDDLVTMIQDGLIKR